MPDHDYQAEFRVSDDGRLDAVETITAEFPYGRHGIFRFFDLSDPSDSHVRLEPEDIEVRRDGQPDADRPVLAERAAVPRGPDR